MSQWPSSKARRVYKALLRIGWVEQHIIKGSPTSNSAVKAIPTLRGHSTTQTNRPEDARPHRQTDRPDTARPLKPDEAATLVHETAIVAIKLSTLRQLIQQLDQQYGDALKREP